MKNIRIIFLFSLLFVAGCEGSRDSEGVGENRIDMLRGGDSVSNDKGRYKELETSTKEKASGRLSGRVRF